MGRAGAPMDVAGGRGPRIYVDFDDVLCETARSLSALLAAEFGKRVAYEEIRWFDLGRSFGLSGDELEHLFRAVHSPEGIRGLRPVPGASAVLSRWRAQGCEVCIVTGRPPETAPSSRQWLSEHKTPYDRLLFVDKYGRLPPGPDLITLDELAGMGFAFAIDDAPAMLDILVGTMAMPVFVYHRPWNVEFGAADSRAIRCRSWREIEGQAEKLLRGAAR